MNPLKISAVSYLNTYPFVYGLMQSGTLAGYKLNLDVPSVCASKLASGEADIALVPVGAVPDFPSSDIISGYCIGAVNKVKTVLLLSRTPLELIREVALDMDSRTSVQLVKVLAREYWKISPTWKSVPPEKITGQDTIDAVVAIGDKTFELAKKYPYIYDLAEEWIRFTSLPFVFAVWLTTKDIPASKLDAFNRALEFGVMHIDETLEYFKDKLPVGEDCNAYLKKNISFTFDTQKKKGMNLFLELLQK